jgi:glycosyltransferase involved in cell wall biosynthesis
MRNRALEPSLPVIAINSSSDRSQEAADRVSLAKPTAAMNGASVSAPARPSVCFVAPNAYAALSERQDLAHVGGAERQQVLLSQDLVRRGYQVSFVVLDHGQPDGEMLHGIRVFKCYRSDRGVRGLRFFHPRLTGLWKAMKRADSDLYYQRGAAYETGLVGRWCRKHERGFIFSVAHDTNCMPTTPLMTRSERLLFRHGLRCADAIISQTIRQQHMLREGFGLASTVVRSASPWSADLEEPAECGARDELTGRVLWVGRLSKEKRPEWLIRLATDLPECRFDVVGQCNTSSRYGQTLAGNIESLPNVRWHGYIDHARLRALYQQTQVLLCTSESEGFPNVFLEAWSCAKPVLTSVDPDGIVAKFQLGQVGTDYPALKQHLRELVARRPMWKACGQRGYLYVREHHGAAAAGDALEGVIQAFYQSLQARRSSSAIFPGSDV